MLPITVALVSALGLPSVANATTEIKAAFNQSDQHPQYQALHEFGEKLQEATDGRYSLKIYPNELLGDQRSSLELVQNGAVQMAVVANPLVENYNRNFSVISLPYVYSGYDHQQAVFTTGVLDDLFKETSRMGFEVVAAYTGGARSIYSKAGPVNSIKDMNGMKIRVMQSDTMIKTLGCMGGQGVPMGQGEVYSAIQQGVLYGAENSEITYYDLKQYEVAGYYSATRHLMVPDLVVASSFFLNSMSKEDRAAFERLAKESVGTQFDLWKKQVSISKKAAEDTGAKFNEVDIEPFVQACKPLQEELIQTPEQKAIYERITALL
ncbi:TRAP transporter substrate-binding protein [Vibrio breoganii]|uniref:TRAP transporter substrate-binding protein n=2 Tax=Vibrio TaxID=662 RepID=UPI000C83597E|nr:C4-dicarboxylate ABC transporter [Vibrio breoganii]PMJ46681.1 C4-dicarboxylate ABC transporter [Vibrio breoganii]PMK60493.1 C4-dicarboxylate ABC transporter [Vibrio breoganii]PMM89785.1 C4-dicarboxylate ABC transporter [Vibrio breoganii]PMO27463.1 C4-dicarboxylate ABC transporter [Vibrio breoganii]